MAGNEVPGTKVRGRRGLSEAALGSLPGQGQPLAHAQSSAEYLLNYSLKSHLFSQEEKKIKKSPGTGAKSGDFQATPFLPHDHHAQNLSPCLRAGTYSKVFEKVIENGIKM